MRFNLENAQGENYMAQPQVDDYLNEQITQALLGNKEPRAALEDAYANIERLYQDIGLIWGKYFYIYYVGRKKMTCVGNSTGCSYR